MNRLAGKSKSWKRPRFSRAFYLDEGVPAYVAVFLRANRCNVELVPASRRGDTDIKQLSYATKNERIFLAVDKDATGYGFPSRRILQSHGVVVLTVQPPTEERFGQILRKLLVYLDNHSIKGRLCLVSDAAVRIKELSE